MGVLFVLSLSIFVPNLFGKELSFSRANTGFVDSERQPLLEE